ncbi:MAG: tetraacyldisaccharide 4'-kinase [bacterium]|nr:tetraacyldisaccharide 4'-kinase [bacterium]
MKSPLTDLRGVTGQVPSRSGLPLRILGVLYGMVASAHCKINRQSRIVTRKPLISLGNLEVGGTGKTPATLAIGELLRKIGFRPGLLTGLAGQSRNHKICRSVDPWFFTEAPDEAKLLAAGSPDCPVVAAHRKWRGARILDDDPACDIIILDDGFQHHRLARDIDLVLLSGREPLRVDRVLPGGGLREFPGALHRASGLILPEGCGMADLPSGKPLFRYRIVEQGLRNWNGNPVEPDGTGYVCISGMAAPERFEESAAGIAHVAGRLRFKDHAPWTPAIETAIERFLRKYPDSRPLITEKDAARWQNKWDLSGKRPHILRISMRWQNPAELSLWLENTLRSIRRDQSSSP